MMWGGLEYDNRFTLLDGSAGHEWWFYAIGGMKIWNEGIPGHTKPVDIVDLYLASQSKLF